MKKAVPFIGAGKEQISFIRVNRVLCFGKKAFRGGGLL
jgi:hypothetical protein